MVLMLKQAHSRSNLRVRTLAAMVKARPSRPRPLTLRLLNAPAHALFTFRLNLAYSWGKMKDTIMFWR